MSLNKGVSMDNFERQLKDDADAIDAKVSPALQARLDATLHALEPKPVSAPKSRSGIGWWWLSSLTGVAAALLLIVYLNRGAPVADLPPSVAADPVPVDSVAPLAEFPLDVRSAEFADDFADPLATELENLKSDFEKAADKLGYDLGRTL